MTRVAADEAAQGQEDVGGTQLSLVAESFRIHAIAFENH
jgi:hypothetical protein